MVTFLCATDFTACSENAINYANDLAQLFNARIILFHSIQAVAPTFPIFGGITPHERLEIELEERKEFLQRMETIKMHLEYQNPESNINFESQVRHGLAKDTIPDLIRQERVDLVIMGNEEANSLQEIFVGTIASDIIARSSCPVLIIPQSAAFRPLRRIVFASDLRHAPFIDLGFPLDMAALFNAEIMLLHILTDNLPEARDSAYEDLSKFYSSIPYKLVSLHLEYNPHIEEGISNFIRDNYADMLVISYHPRKAWQHLIPESPMQNQVYHTYLPMLILHQEEN